MALKTAIKLSISRRKYEAFSALVFASKSGDVEVVRDLVRKGADINQADHDGRTAFAMVNSSSYGVFKFSFLLTGPSMTKIYQACAEGSYKVVEYMLEEGVEKDVKNRWRKTPLEEAVQNRHAPILC